VHYMVCPDADPATADVLSDEFCRLGLLIA
jgi:hypothetical protein